MKSIIRSLFRYSSCPKSPSAVAEVARLWIPLGLSKAWRLRLPISATIDCGPVLKTAIWLVLLPALCSQAAVTERQRGVAQKLAQVTLEAGQLYAAGDFTPSAEKIAAVQQELIKLLQSSDADLQALLEPTYQRIARAHELLKLKGIALEALPSWEELIAAAPPDTPAPAATSVPRPAPSAMTESTDSGDTAQGPGDRSISFARTIAPILRDNCRGCHIGGRQTSGGLRMDNFAQLTRGGDSGEIVTAGNSSDSLLVQRLKGEGGDRMPAGGRPALSADQIAAIAAWIDAGAIFDGPSADMNIQTVIDQVWADSSDHQELFERRQQLALQRWGRVLPNDSPLTASNDGLFVLGNVPQERLDAILEQMQAAVTSTQKLLKAPTAQPLIRGGLTVFVLKSRYDYSEFGRMSEGRELPKQWLGHWHADPLDTYGVLAADSTSSDARAADKQAEALALQIASGAYIGSFAQVPTWFAEGVARNLVKNAFRRSDTRLAVWQQAYPAALLKVVNAKTLLEGRLDQEAAGLVGMGLTGFMMERNNRRRFDQLLEMLRAGQTFDAACTATFAPPEALVTTWLGK